MAHSRLFEALRDTLSVGQQAASRGIGTEQAFEQRDEARHRRTQTGIDRRRFLGVLGGAALGTALAAKGYAKTKVSGGPRIAIIGAGLAGMVCADVLAGKGFKATIYEANTRIGGRVHSDTATFPGQVAEIGGELIDNPHKTMLGYANALGLAREDTTKYGGSVKYFYGGQLYDDIAVVEEFRELCKRVRGDLQALNSPTAFSYTPAEAALDWMDLQTWLDSRAAGLPLIAGVLNTAYNIEYGVEASEQSSLALLQFMRFNGRAKFAPFGTSDERYHIVGGNAGIIDGIAAYLPGPIQLGAQLTRLRKNAAGEFEMFFGGSTTPTLADVVVLTLPFSVLRTVTLEASLGLSPDKLRVINDYVYGRNVKTMIGFDGRPWLTGHDCNGAVYADLPNLNTTWETNASQAGVTSILTDYSGGARGHDLQMGEPTARPGCSNCHNGPGGFLDIKPSAMQIQADLFLTDFDKALPGTKAAATRVNGQYRLARGHWESQKYSKGSYTANGPGYFTTMAGIEALPAGALKFAGEHTDSFYSWQGYMEGACLSGMAAANEVLADIKSGAV